ncbi:MAG: IPT/TIG domain-containing protein [Betaproteobacteria bacterium]
MKKLLFCAALLVAIFGASSDASAACTTQPIVPGDTVNGILATDDCIDNNTNGRQYYYDYYEFSGFVGQQIQISTTSTAIDPDLLLIFPDGSTFLYDDDGAGGLNPRIPSAGGYLTLTVAGKYHIVASSAVALATGPYTMTLGTPTPPPAAATTIEFYNKDLKHYFITASPAEATGIDNGAAGPGWIRTGFAYNIFLTPTAVAGLDKVVTATANPVCRFYGTPGVGPNSHFYTVDAAECTSVKTDPGWLFETGTAYYIQPPQFGTCPAGTQPVYRVYNNRAQFRDSNHRFLTNKSTFLQMGELGWALEGIVMCTTGTKSPTPVTGGTFKDPGSPATVTIAAGQLPPYVNATAPSTSRGAGLPPGLDVNPNRGDTNVTQGGNPVDFNLSGDSGFSTTTAGAVGISLPFDATLVPATDVLAPGRLVARVLDPQDGSLVDLTGDVTVTGNTGILTVETRGLPREFSAIVVHNPNIEAVTSDEAAPGAVESTGIEEKVGTTWPAQSWCIMYNRTNPNLIAAVRNVLALAGNPTAAQLRSVILDKVGGSAKKAQSIYERDGHIGPNLFIGRTCGGAPTRYNIHMTDVGSKFQPNDPGEAISSGADHYGRLYVSNGRVDDAGNTDLGTVLASVAHEMYHGVQRSYEILGSTVKGYREGSAAVYGKTIDSGEVITVRSESALLSKSLITSASPYGNEDFFAYVGRQYGAGKLSYLSGLFAQMRATIGAGVNNPAASIAYAAMDTYFKATFMQSLEAVYLDFVKQRALAHNAASRLRASDPATGFVPGLFSANFVYTHNLDLANCKTKTAVQTNGLESFATTAIVIKPTGPMPTGNGPNVIVKVTPRSSALGALWNGFTYRGAAVGTIAASNKFSNFGKQPTDEIVLLLSNLDPANAGANDWEISCGIVIDTISPVKGPVDTVVTINGSGFGTAADTRAVYFNGVKATVVNFVSDTQVTAKVPANASSGDVVVEVNTEKSNGVNFEVIAQCSATQTAGGDTPDTRTVELGKTSGTFVFTYETFAQEDQIIVRYQNNVLFDTGCVGANGSVPLPYSGTSTQISVQVIPNCKGGTGTAWNYSVSCP